MSEDNVNGWNRPNSLSYDPDLGPDLKYSHDPVAMAKAAQALSLTSRRFIERFTALDTAPINPVDPTTTTQRNTQIVQITRRIASEQLRYANDEQVLDFYRTALMGWY